jgi:hypothetical protein
LFELVRRFTACHLCQLRPISAVPEPSTSAMMILGFLGIGVMAYRKKSALRFA